MEDPSIREYYERRYGAQWEQAFPRDPARYRAWFGPLLDRQRPGARMLDYGSGVGYICSDFAALGYDVTGVDISSTAVALARRREPRATFIEASAASPLPFPDSSFDVIACLGVLEHVPDPEPLVAELRRVTRGSGIGVWVLPNIRSPFFSFGHGTGQVEEHPRRLSEWLHLLKEGGWIVRNVRRDPGPLDRPVARWKRLAQAMLNCLPLGFTYQFVIETAKSDH